MRGERTFVPGKRVEPIMLDDQKKKNERRMGGGEEQASLWIPLL